MKKEASKNLINHPLSDRPIGVNDRDAFHFKERIVNKIYSFLTDAPISPLTIAITGEWGIGKSSVINLLKTELEKDKQNVLISFDPLLEGKESVPDIIELFYLQLYSSVKNEDIKKIVKKSLLSLLLLARVKIGAKVVVEGIREVAIEKDIGKDIDDILEVWKSQGLQLFSDQTSELSKELRKLNYKLYIFIDEIDRLTSEKMINFLLFARVLEQFDDLVCVIGIDYGQALSKLANENYLGLNDQASAKAYLDKLFQCKFHVSINQNDKLAFGVKALKNIDTDKCLDEILESKNYLAAEELNGIIEYLSTPRQVKKWLVSIKINYFIIKNFPEKLILLKFLSVATKYPLLLDNLAKYTVGLLKSGSMQSYLKEKYGIDTIGDRGEFEKGSILLASLGVVQKNCFAKKFYDQLVKGKSHIEFCDSTLEKFSSQFLEKMPISAIFLLAEGYSDDAKVAAYNNFFSGDVDLALSEILKDSKYSDILASDLAETLRDFSLKLPKNPDINLLNKLWREKCINSLFGPYPEVVLFALANHGSMEEIIDQADFSLSERLICQVLYAFGISNQNGRYDIQKFNDDNDNTNRLSELLAIPREKEALKIILRQWLSAVKNALEDFSGKKNPWFKQDGLVSVFYRFVQFGSECDIEDSKQQLSAALLNFFNRKDIAQEDKSVIVKLISEECLKFQNPLIGIVSGENPLDALFDSDADLLNAIKNYSEGVSAECIEAFSAASKTRLCATSLEPCEELA